MKILELATSEKFNSIFNHHPLINYLAKNICNFIEILQQNIVYKSTISFIEIN